MSEITLSGLARAVACPASAALPQAKSSGKAAVRGTVIHKFLHDVMQVGREEALLLVPEEHRTACALIDLSKLPACEPDKFASEVAFAYDPRFDTARELGRGMDREDAYAMLLPAEVGGTTDIAGLAGEDAVWIADYKTGWHDLGPVKENLQLRGYALAAARTWGRSRALVNIIRIKEDGSSWSDSAELSSDELDETARTIVLTSLRIRELRNSEAVPVPHEGDHCTYCPAFNSCPAKMNLLRSLTAEGLTLTDNESARLVHEKLAMAKAVVKRIEEVLDQWAGEHPIDLGGGWVYGKKKHPREVIDPDLGQKVLTNLYGDETAKRAVETVTEMTKSKLTSALRFFQQSQKGVKLNALEKTALAALRTAGAARTSYTYPVTKFKPKEEADHVEAAGEGSAGARGGAARARRQIDAGGVDPQVGPAGETVGPGGGGREGLQDNSGGVQGEEGRVRRASQAIVESGQRQG